MLEKWAKRSKYIISRPFLLLPFILLFSDRLIGVLAVDHLRTDKTSEISEATAVKYCIKTIISPLHSTWRAYVAKTLALNFQLINENIGLFVQIWRDYYTCMGLGHKIIKLSFRFE